VRSRSPDARLLRRTALRLGAQAAGLVAAAVLALVGLAVAVVLSAQRSAAENLLRDAVARADDVNDPPAGIWLAIQLGAGTAVSPGMPPGLPDPSALQSVARGPQLEETVHRRGRAFRVLTVRTPNGAVQAVLDLSAEHAERERLLRALLAAGSLGLALAVAAGSLLGRRAVRPLADALALQRRFVADASHELRTPLTLLSTRAQLLARDLGRMHPDVPALRRDAAGVVGDARRLGDVVEDLLVAADPRVPAEPIDLGQLLREVTEASSAYAAERGVRFETTVPPEPLVLSGHAAALRRALLALVDNAVEHSPIGGSVRLRCGREGSHRMRITVSDKGPGVDPANSGGLFARFSSGGHSAGRRRYGLGLALADEVAARHGGRVELVSTPPGAGATFALVLDRAPRSARTRRRWRFRSRARDEATSPR